MTFRLIAPLTIALMSGGFALAQPVNPGVHFVENWDMNDDGQVTLDEAREKRGDIFYMFDADENGMLNGPEYDQFDETRKADMDANGGGHMGQQMRSPNKGMMRQYNDPNGDGMVSRSEFMNGSISWFDMVDRNGDGVITEDDFTGMGG
jgi:Ca2+-binding EF-hand superfamily protein